MLGFQNMAVEDNIVIRVVVGRFSNRFLVPVPITDSLYIGTGTFAMQKCVAVIEFAYTIQYITSSILRHRRIVCHDLY